jgi:hypothetical protein
MVGSRLRGPEGFVGQVGASVGLTHQSGWYLPVSSGEIWSLSGTSPDQSLITNHQSLLTLASCLKELLVRAERISVMLPNNAFHFVGVAGFDGFENLPMFFLRVW